MKRATQQQENEARILTTQIKATQNAQELLALITKNPDQLNPIHIGVILNQLNQFHNTTDMSFYPCLNTIIEIAAAQFERMTDVNVAIICNTLTHLKITNCDFLIKAVSYYSKNIPDLSKTQELAMLANALSKVDANTSGFNEAIIAIAQIAINRGLEGFAPQGIAMLVNAVSKVDANTPRFNEAIMAIAQNAIDLRLQNFNPQDIAMLANAVSKVDANTPRFNEAIIAIAQIAINRGLEGFAPQGIAMLANAVSKLDANTPGLNEAIMAIAQKAINQKLAGFEPQDIALLANALSKVDTNTPGFNQAIMAIAQKAINQKLAGFKPQEIAMLANALSKLDANTPGFNQAIMAIAQEAINLQLAGFETQGIAMLANMLAVFDVNISILDNMLLNEINSILSKNDNLIEENATQLHWYLLNLEARDNLSYDVKKYIDLLSHLTETRGAPRVSSFQEDVTSIAKRVFERSEIQEEYPIISSHVDIAIPELKIIIEAQGPSHYGENGRTPTPSSQLKIKLLEHSGCTVIQIPFYEWKNFENDIEKINYMKSKLPPALTHSASLASRFQTLTIGHPHQPTFSGIAPPAQSRSTLDPNAKTFVPGYPTTNSTTSNASFPKDAESARKSRTSVSSVGGHSL